MKDRAWFELKLEEIRQHQKKVLADYNACAGAAQFCEQAIQELLQDEQAAKEAEPAE